MSIIANCSAPLCSISRMLYFWSLGLIVPKSINRKTEEWILRWKYRIQYRKLCWESEIKSQEVACRCHSMRVPKRMNNEGCWCLGILSEHLLLQYRSGCYFGAPWPHRNPYQFQSEVVVPKPIEPKLDSRKTLCTTSSKLVKKILPLCTYWI